MGLIFETQFRIGPGIPHLAKDWVCLKHGIGELTAMLFLLLILHLQIEWEEECSNHIKHLLVCQPYSFFMMLYVVESIKKTSYICLLLSSIWSITNPIHWLLCTVCWVELCKSPQKSWVLALVQVFSQLSPKKDCIEYFIKTFPLYSLCGFVNPFTQNYLTSKAPRKTSLEARNHTVMKPSSKSTFSDLWPNRITGLFDFWSGSIIFDIYFWVWDGMGTWALYLWISCVLS